MAQLKVELWEVLLGSKMNALLLPLPFALVSHAAGWPPGATFVLALLPLCSLAEVGRAPGGTGAAAAHV